MATYYNNGDVPASARRSVHFPGMDGSISLAIPTANAVTRMVAAARNDGVMLYVLEPVGGYRSYTTQSAMHNPANRKRYNIDPNFNLANLSAAGHSPHGFGRAVDFNAGARSWLQRHAHTYGFSWPLGASDPNHWVHDGQTAGGAIISTSSSTVTSILKRITKGETMIMLLPTGGYKKGKTLVLADPFTLSKEGIPSDRVKSLKAIGVPLKKISAEDLTRINDQVKANRAERDQLAAAPKVI